MKIDRDKQQQALERAKEILQESERRRAAVRLEKNFRDVAGGSVSALENDEIVVNFANFMYAIHEGGEDDQVNAALDTLGHGICHENRKMRERAIMVISIFIGLNLDNKETVFNRKLAGILADWLSKEEEFIAGFDTITRQMRQMMQEMFDLGQWREAEALMIVIHQISSGFTQKNNAIKKILQNVQNRLSGKSVTDLLLASYLNPHSGNRETAETLLTHLGSNTLTHIIDRLVEEEDREKRFLLIELVPKSRKVFDIIKELLNDEQPWYVIRNCMILLSGNNDEDLYELIEPYAGHSDMRVQQQVVNSIWKIGGRSLKKRLLKVLNIINDELKPAFIARLGHMHGDKEIGAALTDMLIRRGEFPKFVREDIVLGLAEQLAFFPSPETLAEMKILIEQRRKINDENDPILHAAEISLKIMENEAISRKLADKTTQAGSQEEEMLFLDMSEDGLVMAANETDEEDILHDEKDDAFLEIMAETQNKSSASVHALPEDKDHLSIWSDFYDAFSSDEFSAFYAALKKQEYNAGELLAAKGDEARKLFLIDSGNVILTTEKNEVNIHLRHLRSGNMIGSSFFAGSPWPFFMTAQDKVACHVLDKEGLEQLENQPEIRKKLKDYCKFHDIISLLLDMLKKPRPHENQVRIVNTNSSLGFIKTSEKDNNTGQCLGGINGGMCIEIPAESKSKNKSRYEICDTLVETFLCDKDGKYEKVFGVVSGWQQTEGGKLKLLIKFYRPCQANQYLCDTLTLL
ncbi:MAG: hypothetical protein CSB24_00060 [Deltaproteobacteria bacterium]|nr:MAG: hypothetical protein CSB24_00060 [Deltaproteobacteria bacterium]